MLKDVFSAAVISRHNSSVLIITFSALGSFVTSHLGGTSLQIALAAVATGVIGCSVGRLVDGYAEVKANHIVERRRAEKLHPYI